ncbi:MAG: 50S ribosomal protein L28 [Candidatus Aminicenantes bacterium]|nr:50S ribosomal protein L28 [Candidatus Aminicenantes bacterium]
MAKVCQICGKGPQFGNNVSHAHNLSRRKWSPNLQRVRANINGTTRRIRVCAKCLKNGRVQKPAIH